MTLSGHSEGISSTAWITDTSLCSASWDHSIHLWDLQQATTVSTFVSSFVIAKIVFIYLAISKFVFSIICFLYFYTLVLFP